MLLRGVACVVSCLLVGGCLFAPGPTTIPIGQQRHQLARDGRARCLILMMPGFGDRAETFKKRGFVAEVRRAKVNADVLALDAHYGYYKEGVLLERVYTDVLSKAKAHGYKVWVLGASMGGAGSLGVAAAFPQLISGVILFAPYLGDDIVDEVQKAGGIHKWQPGAFFEPSRYRRTATPPWNPAWRKDRAGFFRYLWSWARKRPRPDGTVVPLYLGIGKQDRLATPNRLLGHALPKEHVLEDPGGHGWRAWRPLWRRFLERGFLQASCAAPAAGN